LRDVVNHTFMLSSANSLKVQELEQRYPLSEGEQRRIEAAWTTSSTALSDVEKKVDE
jgi:hypothetical protein